MDFIAQSVVIGLTEHAPLVLAAIGFALIYRLTGLINVAYSETITLGAYFGMWLNTTFELDFFAVLIPTAILSGLLSVATYLLIFRPAKQREGGRARDDHHLLRPLDLPAPRAAVHLRLPVRFFDVPPAETIYILDVGVSSFRLVALVSVIILALLLYLFIQRSKYGLQVRALASR